MKINLAKHIGFCSGVKRAVAIAEKTLKEGSGPVFMLGPLIHNKEVMTNFLRQGVKVVSSIKKIPRGSFLIISAHGVGPKIKEKALKKKIKVVDTTCPWVFHTQKFAEKLSLEGYQIILVGDKNHQEVKGIQEWGKRKMRIISKIGEAKKLIKSRFREGKIVVLSQTTQDAENFKKITEFLKKSFSRIKILNTICPDSRERQREIRKIAKKNDLMIIIGSKSSVNSRRLFKISKKLNKNSYFVNSPDDLKKVWFESKIRYLGIISGASTPLSIIEKIRGRIESFL